MLKLADLVIAGNEHLCEYSRDFNKNVVLINTPLESSYYTPIRKKKIGRTIGWIGSRENQLNLNSLVPHIPNLIKNSNCRFLIISDENTFHNNPHIDFLTWNLPEHINLLNTIDIGIMPLENNLWNESKCGFKLLEYLFMNIPSIASPVGINKQIISHGVNGFLANSPEDFIKFINILLEDSDIYHKFQTNGRRSVESRFGVSTNYKLLIKCLEEI